jgi:hypothetical protein
MTRTVPPELSSSGGGSGSTRPLDGPNPTDLYLDAGGSDSNDGLTVGTPKLTIQGIIDVLPLSPTGACTVHCGPGEFLMPPKTLDLHNVKFMGTTTVVHTDSAFGPVVTAALGISFAPGVGGGTKGDILEWTSGAAVGTKGVLYDVTFGDNVCTFDDAAALPGVLDGDAYTVSSRDTRFVSADDLIYFQGCTDLSYDDIAFGNSAGANKSWYFTATEKIAFTNCALLPEMAGFRALTGGNFWLINCFVQTVNLVAVQAASGGAVTIQRGTYFFGTNANHKIDIKTNSSLVLQGNVVLENMGGGLLFNGAQVTLQGPYTVADGIGFVGVTGPIVFNGDGTGAAGGGVLPSLGGALPLPYTVVAQNGANVVIGGGIARAVSADGGVSAISTNPADFTRIQGGLPA